MLLTSNLSFVHTSGSHTWSIRPKMGVNKITFALPYKLEGTITVLNAFSILQNLFT
jgi:hypothetical protein